MQWGNARPMGCAIGTIYHAKTGACENREDLFVWMHATFGMPIAIVMQLNYCHFEGETREWLANWLELQGY